MRTLTVAAGREQGRATNLAGEMEVEGEGSNLQLGLVGPNHRPSRKTPS